MLVQRKAADEIKQVDINAKRSLKANNVILNEIGDTATVISIN